MKFWVFGLIVECVNDDKANIQLAMDARTFSRKINGAQPATRGNIFMRI